MKSLRLITKNTLTKVKNIKDTPKDRKFRISHYHKHHLAPPRKIKRLYNFLIIDYALNLLPSLLLKVGGGYNTSGLWLSILVQLRAMNDDEKT